MRTFSFLTRFFFVEGFFAAAALVLRLLARFFGCPTLVSEFVGFSGFWLVTASVESVTVFGFLFRVKLVVRPV